jgi:uncharacterized protein (UPF0332 family)
MSHLKNKSSLNLNAAEFLCSEGYHPAVVHCAYYSCFQLMKHTWLFSMGKTNEALRTLNNNSRNGSHEVLINQLKLYIKSKSQDDRDFNTIILQLKRLRVHADYVNVSIGSTQSNQSIALSKSAQQILKKCI